MFRKSQNTTFNNHSQTFQAYRKVRQSNTFRSQIFTQNVKSDKPIVQKKINQSNTHQNIFDEQVTTTKTPQKVRVNDTNSHTEIFLDQTSYFDRQTSPIISQTRSEQKFQNMTRSTDRINHIKFNKEDIYPCEWQNSIIHPGQPGLCNENANFPLSYSKLRKLIDQTGTLGKTDEQQKECVERAINLSMVLSNRESIKDGQGIMPSTVSWNMFDSLSYRKAQLKPHSYIQPIDKNDSLSPNKKRISEQSSSLDQEGIRMARKNQLNKSPDDRNTQRKIDAFLNNEMKEIEKDGISEGFQKNIYEGAKSNNLYGVTQKSPLQPKEEPKVIQFNIDTSNGKLDKEDLRKYCLEKGFGLMKAEEQVNKVSNRPTGMTNISLRVKNFQDQDSKDLNQFLNSKGASYLKHSNRSPKIYNENDNRPIKTEISEKSFRDNSQQNKLNEGFNQFRQFKPNNIQVERKASVSPYGVKVSPFNQKKENSSLIFEQTLRSNDSNSIKQTVYNACYKR